MPIRDDGAERIGLRMMSLDSIIGFRRIPAHSDNANTVVRLGLLLRRLGGMGFTAVSRVEGAEGAPSAYVPTVRMIMGRSTAATLRGAKEVKEGSEHCGKYSNAAYDTTSNSAFVDGRYGTYDSSGGRTGGRRRHAAHGGG